VHGGVGKQVQRLDAGMMYLQVPPKQSTQGVGELVQARVIQAGLTLAQIVHE
jgi:hypothetical protein